MQVDGAAIFEIFKTLIIAYCVFVLNKADRNQRELFSRLRVVELNCAKNHGSTFKPVE